MDEIKPYLARITLPHPQSHKGQNGKLLIIGGSELFHAASRWSLEVASKFVDMVFYASVPANNELIREAKGEFWNGIIVPRQEVESYVEEADAVLIGPGMERHQPTQPEPTPEQPLTPDEWQQDTRRVVNYLLKKYPSKKWVIDAGALQMVEATLLNEHCLLTPHQRELGMLLAQFEQAPVVKSGEMAVSQLQPLLDLGVTLLIKGPTDQVLRGDQQYAIPGGNAGMTKGGTGDVLAGLAAALYTTHDVLTSAIVASYLNKKAGDAMYQRVGPYFNATDLVEEIPKVLWEALQQLNAPISSATKP